MHIIESNLTKSITPVANTGMRRSAVNYSTAKTSKQQQFLSRNARELDQQSGDNVLGKQANSHLTGAMGQAWLQQKPMSSATKTRSQKMFKLQNEKDKQPPASTTGLKVMARTQRDSFQNFVSQPFLHKDQSQKPAATDVTQDGVKTTILSGFRYRTENNNSNMQILDSTTTDRLMEPTDRDGLDSAHIAAGSTLYPTVQSLDQRAERRKNVISESRATLNRIKSKILSRTHGKFRIK